MYGKKIELVIDGTMVDIANVNRARTQKISDRVYMSILNKIREGMTELELRSLIVSEFFQVWRHG